MYEVTQPYANRAQGWWALEVNELSPTWFHIVSAHCVISKSG